MYNISQIPSHSQNVANLIFNQQDRKFIRGYNFRFLNLPLNISHSPFPDNPTEGSHKSYNNPVKLHAGLIVQNIGDFSDCTLLSPDLISFISRINSFCPENILHLANRSTSYSVQSKRANSVSTWVQQILLYINHQNYDCTRLNGTYKIVYSLYMYTIYYYTCIIKMIFSINSMLLIHNNKILYCVLIVAKITPADSISPNIVRQVDQLENILRELA